MIVLDQDAAAEIHAMIRSATGAHGVLLERSPARCRLAGVEDVGRCPLDRLDETAGQRRDAREMLQIVQRRTLRRQHAAGMTADVHHDVTSLHVRAVVRLDANRDGAVELSKRLDSQWHAGDHAVASRHDRAAHMTAADDGRQRGHIIERLIFLQGHPNLRRDLRIGQRERQRRNVNRARAVRRDGPGRHRRRPVRRRGA